VICVVQSSQWFPVSVVPGMIDWPVWVVVVYTTPPADARLGAASATNTSTAAGTIEHSRRRRTRFIPSPFVDSPCGKVLPPFFAQVKPGAALARAEDAGARCVRAPTSSLEQFG
jgi:hypothetical protein